MKLKDLRNAVNAIDPAHDELEVWGAHPENGIQWGEIGGIALAVTPRFQQIVLIHWDTEDDESQRP